MPVSAAHVEATEKNPCGTGLGSHMDRLVARIATGSNTTRVRIEPDFSCVPQVHHFRPQE